MTYQEYLQSPEWKALRRRAIDRDGGRCRLCNSNKRLEVHHRTYTRFLGEEPIENLTTLCYRCHKLYTYSVQKPNVPIPKAKYQPKQPVSEVDKRIAYERAKRNVIVFSNQLRNAKDRKSRERMRKLISKWQRRVNKYEPSAWDKTVPTYAELEYVVA